MKKVLSVLLTVSILIGVMIPAFSASGEDAVSVFANALQDLVIEKEKTLPTEPDYNGTLVLTGGSYKIDRDYAQAIQVTVKNTASKNMEYYLTVENIYKDLYMNFVRNGSVDSPLVIAPGETQQVQLDIFAQNAAGGSYKLPVYATLVDGTHETKDAKTTLTVQCDTVSLNLSCTEVSSSAHTLAKTMRLTNKGEALTDVTLSLSGEAADYVQLNPIVSNYQMDRNASVEFKASPDLTKMKNNRVSVVSGSIVATAGGKTQSFPVVFDTQGQEITSTTMGQLALKQNGFDVSKIRAEIIKINIYDAEETTTIEGVDLRTFSPKEYINANGEVSFELFFCVYGIMEESEYFSLKLSTQLLQSELENDPKCDYQLVDGAISSSYSTSVSAEDFLQMLGGDIDKNEKNHVKNKARVLRKAERLSEENDLLLSIDIHGFEKVADLAKKYGDSSSALTSEVAIINGLDSIYSGVKIVYSVKDLETIVSNSNVPTNYKVSYACFKVADIILDAVDIFDPTPFTSIISYFIHKDPNYQDAINTIESYAATTKDVYGHQCTNAGKIKIDVYFEDFTMPPENVPVSGIRLSTDQFVLNVGDSSVISATIRPENATNKTLNWETSNPQVATVSNGVVHAVGPGSVVISAKPVNGTGYDSIRLTVRQRVTGVRLNRNTFSAAQVGCTFGLQETVLPENASNKTVTWSSSDPSVASVDSSGIVTALAPGNATITVHTADGGYEDSCSLQVADQSAIRITPESAVVPREQTAHFSVYSTRDDVIIQSVAFSSDDPYIATADTSSGLVTGVKNGTVTIVATVETNIGYFVLTAGVQVTTPVSGVILLYGFNGEATIGSSRSLSVEVKPYDAGNKNVIWESSDNSVATVDQDGHVEMVGIGTATISVTTEEGGFKDSVTYTVVESISPRAIKAAREEDHTSPASSGIGLYVTGRMYGGSYVNTTETNYDYILNGVNVGRSHNSGLTDLDIMELPAQNLKFGAVNTLIRDYDTNPGSHSVTTDTQITITYPADTPISYIGSPEDLEDVRSLPDLAIYSENIFSRDATIIQGKETMIDFNVYNRGSCCGWFNIEVTDSTGVIYSEENYYLDAFSGEKISFDWTPTSEKEDITVKLTNTSIGLDERTTENNTATRTFKARERVVPFINSITPDYAVEEEGIVFATVSNCDDVLKAEFYVDDVLYSGEVKTSVSGNQMKCWINDPSMRKGDHTIKVVITYATGAETSAQISKTASLTVLEKDWDKYSFKLSTTFTNPVFYLYNAASNSYSRISVQRSGASCVYTMTKQVYDNLSDYSICVSTDQGFVFKSMQNADDVLKPENCKSLRFITDSNLTVKRLYVQSFDEHAMNAQIPYANPVLFTPAVYQLSVQFEYLGEQRTVDISVDLSKSDQVVDLTAYVSKYAFRFADPINGIISVNMYYKKSSATTWNSVEMKKAISGNTVTCMLASYNASLLDNADEAFICVSTDDLVFVQNVKPAKPTAETITIDKNKLQKYSLSASGDDSNFNVLEVHVSCDRFSKTLHSDEIYLTPGEYEISVVCRDGNDANYVAAAGKLKATKKVNAAEDTQSTNDLVVTWPLSYLETDAYVYGTGENGNSFSVNPYIMGEAIAVESDRYTVKTQIVRNNSFYSIDSTTNLIDGKEKLEIGDRFDGNITNTFGSYRGNETVRIYLDDLKDAFGNELTYFNSQSESDNLVGFVTLTDRQNPQNSYNIPVSLSRIAYVDIVLPVAEGTYVVSLAVSTTTNVRRDVREIKLEESAITLKCGKTYALHAAVVPENATNSTIIWTSSNSRIATVDENGVVTASKYLPGTATIFATTEDGELTASCTVKVKYNWWQWLICAIFGTAVLTAIMAIIF